MTDRTSMILQWVYRNDTEEQVSSADVVAFDRAVTLEDKRILESCDADVPLADTDGEEMHMRTDYPGVVMRRMLAQLLSDHGETEQRAGGCNDAHDPVAPVRYEAADPVPRRHSHAGSANPRGAG
jgi:hypothetical protein